MMPSASRSFTAKIASGRPADLGSAAERPVPRIDHLEGGFRVGVHSVARPRQPVGDLPHAERPADERQPASPQLDQVRGREVSAHHVVDRQGRLLRRLGGLPDEHRRRAARPDPGQAILDRPVRGHQQPAHLLLLEQLEVGVLPFPAAARVGDVDGEAPLGRPLLHALRDRREVRVAHVRRDVGDGRARAEAQLAACVVPDEAQRVDGGTDALRLLVGHLVGVVEVVRHGADRHPGPERDVADRHAAHSDLLVPSYRFNLANAGAFEPQSRVETFQEPASARR
jgi:hypothetical protein